MLVQRQLHQNMSLMFLFRHPGLTCSPVIRCRSFTTNIIDTSGYVANIGLEVHAQLKTRSKLFSPSSSWYDKAAPNSNVSFFDASLPGTLPVLNKMCLEQVLKTSLSLNCRLSPFSSFDRKHYFYADLPLGYQITQHWYPIATEGFVDFVVYHPKNPKDEPYLKRALVEKVQLEQDSGKTLQDNENNRLLIDLNRAGCALAEIVFAPSITTGHEAACLIRDLILTLKNVGTCNCKLEEGDLRVDANISVRREDEDRLGTRTEVKNLNSLTSIRKAIDYEIQRQIEIVKSGGEVKNETMRFDVVASETVVMRDKESVSDYRFMPEANLPVIRIRDDSVGLSSDGDAIDVTYMKEEIPDQPQVLRVQFMEKYGVDLWTAAHLFQQPELKDIFIQLMEENSKRRGSVVSNFLITSYTKALETCKIKFEDSHGLSIQDMGIIVDKLQKDEIPFLVAEDLVSLKVRGEVKSPDQLIEDMGCKKISDEEQVRTICEEVISRHPKRAKEVSSKGKKFAFNSLMDNVIKASNHCIEKEVIEEMLLKLLQPPGGVVKNSKQRKLEASA